ncbi:hypothetical protein [Microbacterium sp. NPDC057650]|uniref:hypothetical protein n=1 Tax=unclassified Microbacterium TaxID=2609290 RepID=UPI00366DE5F0
MDGWDDVLGALIAPVAALAGALGGVWLTNRHAERTDRRKQVRDDRAGARDLVFTFVQSGQDWAQQVVASTVLSVAASRDGGSLADERVRENMETYGRVRLAHIQASAKLRMFVRDAALQPSIKALRERMEAATSVMSPIHALLHSGQTAQMTSEQLNALFDYAEEYKRELAAFEEAVAPLVGVNISRSRRE